MVKKNKMIFDMKEILCIYDVGEIKLLKKTKRVSLIYNNIQFVSIKPCRERTGLKVAESERITIRTPLLPKPIEYYKFKEGDFFEEYKAGLRIFCKTNRVKMYDEVG